jgi:primosomal protein N' (replication factor Y)
MFGVGTERVESEIKKSMPSARVLRMDRDVVSDITEVERILGTFEAGGADILVGTQMVAKGHHFPWVTFVGIVIADIGLSLPDFRGGERLFALLAQVAGRSGRGTQSGKVLIQTFNPDHYAIQAARHHDYKTFYATELEARRELNYPPFTRIVRLVFEAGSPEKALAAAGLYVSSLGRISGADIEVMGPAPAVISKLKGSYRCQVLVKGTKSLPGAKKLIGQIVTMTGKSHHIPGARVLVDVDPMAML